MFRGCVAKTLAQNVCFSHSEKSYCYKICVCITLVLLLSLLTSCTNTTPLTNLKEGINPCALVTADQVSNLLTIKMEKQYSSSRINQDTTFSAGCVYTIEAYSSVAPALYLGIYLANNKATSRAHFALDKKNSIVAFEVGGGDSSVEVVHDLTGIGEQAFFENGLDAQEHNLYVLQDNIVLSILVVLPQEQRADIVNDEMQLALRAVQQWKKCCHT